MINYIKTLIILTLTAAAATLFSGCETISGQGADCNRILSVSDNYMGCLGDHIKISIAVSAFSLERGIINDAINELKSDPNLSLLIESRVSIWITSDEASAIVKSHLIKIGVDPGRIRKLSQGSNDCLVLVMPAYISLRERDHNRSTWNEDPVVCIHQETIIR